ncbi:MAG: redoxin family protein [Pseudomonadales bacterium]|jgi:peroxiredoxin|nr:peroxiredoxin [Pseudomonadales bacterium]MDG1444113.1 peroxiredoxin [Pseudomonadales bacterium]|tara:strand:+ start:5935 stop:6414 length:480 start_codon:yes stop_codon:yes gene_type:complete
MTVKVGDKVPAATMKVMGAQGPADLTTAELFAGKKVVLFAVPGAFTPTCSAAHLPGFVVNADKIKAKGVDTIVCLSVNDAFVMDAWGKDKNAEELVMAADGNGDFTKAMGLELDGSGFGLGQRSQRYAMIVEDGVVTTLNVEPGPGFEASSAEKIMEAL